MEKIIEIESFNPYESKFPNLKLVNKGTLELIKRLRLAGFEVKVKPDDEKPVKYLFKKGLHDFFSNPVYLFLAGIPTGIMINIVSNIISDIIKNWNTTSSDGRNIIIVNNYLNEMVDLNKKNISKGENNDRKKKLKNEKKAFEKCFSIQSPYPHLPTPIFNQHKPEIVGWCSLDVNDKGLIMEDSVITCKQIKKKLQNGVLKGLSVTGISEVSICNICKNNYVECNHIAGQIYNKKKCGNEVHEATLIEVSLVKTPINEKCLIDLLK